MNSNLFLLISILISISIYECKTFNAINSDKLKLALKRAQAGDTIELADGTFTGRFQASNSGKQNKPIILKGSRNAIIYNPGRDGIILYSISNWILKGFTIFNVSRAVLIEESTFNTLNNLHISYTDTSGIRIRINSTDNVVKNCEISYTGQKEKWNGEGIYIGSAYHHWLNNLTVPDRSNRNHVLNNIIGPYVSSESIDIKPGVEDVLVDSNVINGIGMDDSNKAKAWIGVKGYNCTISNNYGSFSVKHGFTAVTVRQKIVKSGCNNKFINNTCSNLLEDGKCIDFSLAHKCKKDNKDINNINIMY